MAKLIEVHVCPGGNDRAAGTSKSPLATIEKGLTVLRAKRKQASQPAGGKLILHKGTHFLRRPIVLKPADSGITRKNDSALAYPSSDQPLTITSADGEQAVISGGQLITGWRQATINGVSAWAARVPAKLLARGFHSLWVNGRRAARTRLPREGYFQIEKLADPAPKGFAIPKGTEQRRFIYRQGDLTDYANLQDIEFVGLHFWIASRISLAALDSAKRLVTLAWTVRLSLTDDFSGQNAIYYLENVREALTEPGQWYLDRAQQTLYYIPRPGEQMQAAQIIAPFLSELLRLEGDPASGRFVEHVHLQRLTFSHNEYDASQDELQAVPQAACHVPGAVMVRGARYCSIDHCQFQHIGSYGLDVAGGSYDCRVTHSEFSDLSAGGIKIFHDYRDGVAGWDKNATYRQEPLSLPQCQRIIISDNHIHDGGHRDRQAVGVLVGRCSGIQVIHNHIHDLDYTGISVGWVWGYAPSDTFGNIIEYNHIHDIGRGTLSDMGGIYTLGVQTGTRIGHNLIHDIESRGYGGWGIYPDEGSSFMLIENNLIYRTKSASLHIHYGMGNIVCNNILALGRMESLALSRSDNHDAFNFYRNIVFCEHGTLFGVTPDGTNNTEIRATFSNNLYWCNGTKPVFSGGRSFKQWQKAGYDANSIIAPPGFRDIAADDFALASNSPAITQIGFIPFDLKNVGPRK